jgi:hypothetical protein
MRRMGGPARPWHRDVMCPRDKQRREGPDFWSAAARLWREQALVRLFATNAVIGFAMSAIALAGIILLDPGGVGALLRSAPLAIALLWFFLGLTLASVQMGIAVMNLQEDVQQFTPRRDEHDDP